MLASESSADGALLKGVVDLQHIAHLHLYDMYVSTRDRSMHLSWYTLHEYLLRDSYALDMLFALRERVQASSCDTHCDFLVEEGLEGKIEASHHLGEKQRLRALVQNAC